MFTLSILALSLFPISNALSTTNSTVVGPVTEFRVVNADIAPDGYERSATLVNGVFPGPLIQANKNDPFAIQVSNELTDSTMELETSIHWHGILQHKTNWADGVAYVTQCPLVPNQTFEYRFNPADQTGTYWYHSHYSTQYCDGLRGPLVIYDPEDPLAYSYDVDDENTVVTLADWYHSPSTQLSKTFKAVVANSTLINGHGRYSGGPLTPLSVIDVRQGLRYRFRVISMSCAQAFNFTIDGHRMTIIEVDGNEVTPYPVDSIPIHAGQRYSVVVTADKPVGNYWIRSSNAVANPTFQNGQNMAILRYAGAAEEDPTSDAGPYELAFDEGDLHPIVNPGAPGIPEIGKADVNIQLAVGNNSTGYFTLNNVSYESPSVPVLLNILKGAQPSQLLPQGSIYELPLDKVIEISFPDPTAAVGRGHPVHLHGHAFDVVRVSGTNKTNFVNPVRRDVVSIGTLPTDDVTIRFVTDNAGPWFLHCHIDWHLNHGFAVVMVEARSVAAQQEKPPADWYQLCSDSTK